MERSAALASSKITDKGQITVPHEIRKAAMLKVGDRLIFEIRGDCIVLRKPKDLLSYTGFLGEIGLPDDEEDLIDEQVAQRILDRE